MVSHSTPPEDRDWHEYQERLEDHDYAIINTVIALIRSQCKPDYHWVCDRLLEVRHRAAYAETRLAELAAKEDAMRRAGEKARDFLRRKENESI